jgi:hypothetical protein
MEHAPAERTQRIYARLAGFVFLWSIVIGLGGALLLDRIEGNGTFAETAKRIADSERLYRVVLSSAVNVPLSAVLLAFALYVTLKPVNSFLAQLAMIFNLLDSSLGCVVRICGFVKLHLYTSSQLVGAATIPAQALADLMGSIAGATENIGGIFFGVGSLLFFYLFFKSRYVPRILSAVGLFASLIWIGLYFAKLIFPEHRAVFLYICGPPMLVADVATGLWLMVFAVKVPGG